MVLAFSMGIWTNRFFLTLALVGAVLCSPGFSLAAKNTHPIIEDDGAVTIDAEAETPSAIISRQIGGGGLWWVHEFQTLIVGGLGFLGVMSTLWYNARLAGKEREAIRTQDRQGLASALDAELQINETALRLNIEMYEKGIAGPLPIPSIIAPGKPLADVYISLMPRLGLLPAEVIHHVVNTYGMIFNLTRMLKLLPEAQVGPHGDILISETSLGTANGMSQRMLSEVKKTRAALTSVMTSKATVARHMVWRECLQRAFKCG